MYRLSSTVILRFTFLSKASIYTFSNFSPHSPSPYLCHSFLLSLSNLNLERLRSFSLSADVLSSSTNRIQLISRFLWRRSLGFVGVRALGAALLLMVAVVMMMGMVFMMVIGVHQRVSFWLILMAHQQVQRTSWKSSLIVSWRRKWSCYGRLAW